MAKAYLRVRDLETRKIVHSVAINNLSDGHVERVMAGMLRNMNRDKYFIDDSEVDAAKGSEVCNGNNDKTKRNEAQASGQ